MSIKDGPIATANRVLPSLLLAAALLFPSGAAFAQAAPKSPPPPMPAYDQPVCNSSDICPLDGYLWVPGYWAWDGDYYWVPATWVFAPEIGDLWTPGYWSASNGSYVFHEGYWGNAVGYYGGIDYGVGYPGHGFEGARWQDGWLHYNIAVNHVNGRRKDYVYDTPAPDRGSRVSYNGGNSGIAVQQPTADEQAAEQDRRNGISLQQIQNQHFAQIDPLQHFATNQGKPPLIAMPLPHVAIHPQQLPPIEPIAISTGNAQRDQQYQKERDALIAEQDKDRKDMAKRQDVDRLAINKERDSHTYNPLEMEDLRTRHALDTQALYYKQSEQMRQLLIRYQPALADNLKTAN